VKAIDLSADYEIRVSGQKLVAILVALGSLIVTASGGAALVLHRVGELESSDTKTDRLIQQRIATNDDRFQRLNSSVVRLETSLDYIKERGERIEEKLDRLLAPPRR
jgi:hypothetical protein